MSFPASGMATAWRNKWEKVSIINKSKSKFNHFYYRYDNFWINVILKNTIFSTLARRLMTTKDSKAVWEISTGRTITLLHS
jgi:hypothetical protein